MTGRHLQIGLSSPARCYELTAFGHDPAALGVEWPVAAGEVRYVAGDRAAVLHFAPARWLVPDPDAALSERLSELGTRGASLVDVSGKWHVLHLSGEPAARALRSQIPVERILGGRGCAAAPLFDCPCLITMRGDSFDVWTCASYVHCLGQALERAHRSFDGR